MKSFIVICALLVLLAAKPYPVVRVNTGWEIEIGSTKIELPPNVSAYQDKETGTITLNVLMSPNCNAQTEKMVGIAYGGQPVCAPEGSGGSVTAH